MTTLSHITLGSSAKVKNLLLSGNMRRRLLDIGLVEGATATYLFPSPSGDPKAYLIKGAIIALREEEALKVQVEN